MTTGTRSDMNVPAGLVDVAKRLDRKKSAQVAFDNYTESAKLI